MAEIEAITIAFPKLEFPPASGYSKSDSTKPSAKTRRYVFFNCVVQIHGRPTISFQYISEDKGENSY
jgi:hypothetical protein